MRSNLGVLGLLVLLVGCAGSTEGDYYPFGASLGGGSAAGGAGGSGGTSGTGATGGSAGIDASAGSGGIAGAGGSGGSGGDGATLPDGAVAGMGQPCDATPCRAGLVCGSQQKCEAGNSLAEGTACLTSVECKAGLYCGPLKQCAKAGAGVAGASCTSDANCGSGLRCAFVGLSLQCQNAGSSDLGAACTSSSDCLGGLVCASGACTSIAGGLPAAPTPWKGETCETETGVPTAWFHVPRGTDDKDFYRLPFPNDIRMKNGHPDLTGHPTPGTEPLGYDIVDRYLRAIEQDNDGFSAYPTVLFRFNQDIEFSTWTGDAIRWIDITQSAPEFGWGLGRSWGYNPNPSKYICARWLAVRPGQGDPLLPGHTYAVILMSVGKAKGGGQVAPSDDFTAMMKSAAPTADAKLIAAHAAYKPLRAYAAKLETERPEAGSAPGGWIDPATFINAAVFTVGKVTDRAKNVAAATAAAALPSAITWFKCGVDAGASQCSGGCTGADPSFDELTALIPLPIFQKGTAPYLKPENGGDIAAATAPPAVVTTENVCASLTVPKGATMPAAGWPLLIFAHGTGGDYRSHVRDGVAKALAGANAGTAAPIAVLGIDQALNGARRKGSNLSANDLFFNFANPRAARDNVLQGAADQLSLVRIAAAVNVAAGSSPTGAAIKFNPAATLFWGHSQGATEGGVGVPFSGSAPVADGGVPASAGVKAVVLSGEGAGLIDSLLTKTSPTNIASAIPYVLQDPDPGNPQALNSNTINPMLGLLQTFFDPADPLNFAAAMTAKPFAAKASHHLFQVYGLGDTYSTPVTQGTYALAAKIWVVAHDSSVATADKIGGLAETAPPVSSNLVNGLFTGAMREYAPATGDDGHFVAFKNANANADVVRFLAQAALGQIPKVGQ
jgi:hypothetical protein